MLLKDLTTLTASLASGTLFHVEKSGKAYNIDYTKLAKAIVEEYNGSTLGGSAQTVQAAIAALNSNPLINAPRKDSVDLNTLATYGTYQCIRCTNAPTQSWGTLHVLPFGDNNENYLTQDFHMMGSNDVYRRYRDNGTWSAWVKLPTRSELDALEARVTALENK